ncbi:hypothetical protein N7523_004075 [Penicillium sp. IBT 18751x]|nr:hypothetical protein N7523_004075 [Penicillium sp. IBT 18751x]
MPTLPARYGRWVPILIPLALITLFLQLNAGFGDTTQVVLEPASFGTVNDTEVTSTVAATEAAPAEKASTCHPLPGMDDILVVIKTGITEAQHKLPVHIRTTLRCIPNKLIVSDFEEEIDGLRTLDVFRNVSQSLYSNTDFALYNRARQGGRAALIDEDHTKVANSAFGMSDNPGWKLDKWKFLPMIQEARAHRPDAKWYVFLEADTYPIWPNLLAWLENYDSNEKLYLGNQMMIGDTTFAHGGSGFVISNTAIHAVADFYTEHEEEWNEVTDREWAGDCVLGMALARAGIGLTWSWPHVTTQSVWEQDALGEGFGMPQWCYPPFTFHHMTPADVEEMWKFDQEWFSNANRTFLTYGDLFVNFVRPMLTSLSDDWDNNAPDGDNHASYSGPSTPASMYECAEHCARSSGCIQYRVDERGRCTTSGWALRGLPRPGIMSGTMLWRVDAAIKQRGRCRKPNFVTK